MLAWPTSVLPNPTTDFSQDNQASVTRTTMQSGRVRQRRWSTSDRRDMPVNWQLNDDDFELFQSFHKYKLNGGNDWFTIQLPVGGGFKTCTVRFKECAFKASYRTSMNWDVSATLEIQDIPILAEADYDILVGVGGIDVVENSSNELHELVNNTLPQENNFNP